MSFKTILTTALTLMMIALPATAQVSSEGMGELDAWGSRYLETGEKEFPPRLWSGSDDEVLLRLMKSVRTADRKSVV